MISEWFVDVAFNVVTWVLGIFPTWEPDPALVNLDDTVNGVMASFAPLGVWVPWPFVLTTAGVTLAAWGIGVGVKLVRAVIAHVPQIGGAG